MQHRHIPLILGVALLFLLQLSAQAGWDPREEAELQSESQITVQAFLDKDPTLQAFFDKAVGWAVFPTVGKGGFWVGGAYGKGVVYEGGQVIGFSELKQLTVGLQFGGQAYREIIFFKDKRALERFESGKLEFDAQVSAVLVDKGAAANVDYHGGVAVFTLPKGGLMAEASVGGQAFSFRKKGE